MTGANELKRRVKFGPRLSREGQAEYALTAAGVGPRTLSAQSLAKIRSEISRLSASPDPRIRKFVQTMCARYPQLESAK
jgi:hypothetical protein